MKATRFIIAVLLLAVIACKPETDEPNNNEEVLNPKIWSPLFQMGDNVAINTNQNGTEYNVAFLNSILSNNDALATEKSYSFIRLNSPPALAKNTVAYISQDSLYVGKINALSLTKNIGSIVDYGIDKINYRWQPTIYPSEGLLVNERNEIIIPLLNISSNMPAYAYFRLVGDPASENIVSVAEFGIVEVPRLLINDDENNIDKIIQIDNAFFLLFEKSGLFRVENSSILKVLQGRELYDVFKHGNRIAAALKDTLSNKLFFSADNGRNFTNSNNFPALDSIITCSSSFYSDGFEIFSYSDCGQTGIYSHELNGTSIETRKINENGIENFRPTGFIVESNALLFASYQGIYSANRDSIYEIVPDTTDN